MRGTAALREADPRRRDLGMDRPHGRRGTASVIRWTTRYSETDSFGTPELTTAENGRLAREHAVDQFVALVRWVRDRPVEPGREHQATPLTFPLPIAF
jgi:creatinine amidohydrolase/Fe(II)-dependent formamide hydrolase-like protein